MTRLGDIVRRIPGHVRGDLANFYSWPTLRDLTLLTGAAAVMANTRIDADFKEWYQGDVRSRGTDRLADFWRPWGDGVYTVPPLLACSLIGQACDDWPLMETIGNFGDRSLRAYAVGLPPMLLLQNMLGGERPKIGSSHWVFWQSPHGLSGNAFMGAVPFITAAQMAENPFAKGALYALSTVPAWSRVNDNMHYLSQVWMGWWLAYLSCRAVDQTEDGKQSIRIAPILMPEMTGIGLIWER